MDEVDVMLSARFYMLQRITALLMGPFVLVHLAVMIYAVRGGLNAAERLGRTQGSARWFACYGAVVGAVSVHGAIGVRVVLSEWVGLRGTVLSVAMWIVGLGLLLLGARAVWAVTFAGANT